MVKEIHLHYDLSVIFMAALVRVFAALLAVYLVILVKHWKHPGLFGGLVSLQPLQAQDLATNVVVVLEVLKLH